jgi:predicted glycosyltransferase
MDAPLHSRRFEYRRSGPEARRWRIALYSHDTMGIGHMRRNTFIARLIAGSSVPATMLLLAGAREAGCFPLPAGTDCLTLPAYAKEPGGQYQARALHAPVEWLAHLRAQALAAALEAFEPDVLIVDKVPRGALGELEPALEALRAGGRTRCVLGLRDVLDDPATVRREWMDGALPEAVHDYYDAVWVYGDPAVYDQVAEYGYPADMAAKVRYTGYLARPRRTHFSETDFADLFPFRCGAAREDQAGPPQRLFLCMVGGGQDGMAVTEAFARVDFPPQTSGVIVTGPLMPPEDQLRLCRLAGANPRVRVLKFVTDPDLLLSLADRVVAMGGYNTVCELLSFGKRALIVPRVAPRREQLIRAERLRQRGLLDMMHPDHLTPEALGAWLTRDGDAPAARSIDLGGSAALPRALADLLGTEPGPPRAGQFEWSTCHAVS